MSEAESNDVRSPEEVGMLTTSFEELRLSGNLPSPSGVGMKILTLTQHDDYSTQEIAAVIQADPALTGRLLKLANSAESGSRERIVTVGEATMRLGVRAVRNVALGFSLVSANREGSCRGFDYDSYWADSLARAVAAQRIAEVCGLGVPAEAYVAGLLSRIGCLAFACVYPDEYAEVQESVKDETERLRAERERFAITHAEIGACMLEEWGLPEAHGRALVALGARAESGLQPDNSVRIDDVAGVLRGAELIAEVCLEADKDPGHDRFREPLQQLRCALNIDQADFERALESIVDEWREWGASLTIPTEGGERLIHVARPPGAAIASGDGEEATQSELRPTKVLELAPGKGLRILAVDDDPVQLKIVASYLLKMGADVSLATDGRRALQIALAQTPQIVLADYMMPGMDGISVCRALRKIRQGREMYFLLLTGREEEERVLEAFDAGVDDYVTKPFNPKILLARIKAGKRVIELERERANDQDRILRQAGHISRLNRRFQALALTDLLTELRNRRYAMERLQQEWSTCQRMQKPLSVIMIDIDFFKRVNDTHGHAAGDKVLKETATLLRNEVRVGDDAIRLGGEEFLVVCYGTHADQALVCAERVRAATEANRVAYGEHQIGVTLSLGIAELTPEMVGVDDLLKAADEAVYDAKHQGRNRICLHTPSTPRQQTA